MTSSSRSDRLDAKPGHTAGSWVVHGVLGLVLVAAGSLKLYALAHEGEYESLATWPPLALAEAELFGGLWLLLGLDRERATPWVAAAFGGFAIASLYQALAGHCSCGCFGDVVVHPGSAFVFDLAAVAALLRSQPRAGGAAQVLAHPMHALGLAAVALLIGVIAGRDAGAIPVAGTASLGGQPLRSAPLTFIGRTDRVSVSTDEEGGFRLPPVRPGRYAVSTSRRVYDPAPRPRRPSPARGKATRKSSRQPGGPSPPRPGEPLTLVDIIQCDESNINIIF